MSVHCVNRLKSKLDDRHLGLVRKRLKHVPGRQRELAKDEQGPLVTFNLHLTPLEPHLSALAVHLSRPELCSDDGGYLELLRVLL